jgi:hypothetical protein
MLLQQFCGCLAISAYAAFIFDTAVKPFFKKKKKKKNHWHVISCLILYRISSHDF